MEYRPQKLFTAAVTFRLFARATCIYAVIECWSVERSWIGALGWVVALIAWPDSKEQK